MRKYSFLLLIFLMTLILAATERHGVSSVNVEWVYIANGFLFFAVFGYILKALFEGKLNLRRAPYRKHSTMDTVRAVIISLAIVVAVYMLLNPVRRKYPKSWAPKPAVYHFKFFEDALKVTLQPLPWYVYLMPFLILAGILLTVKRRHRELREEYKFEPSMTFDTIEGTAEERIIRMYKNVVAGLVLKGYPYQKSWTHWEHEAKLREIFPDLEDLDRLTRIFEKARYGKRLAEGDIDRAKESYERLMEFLR
ncbi:DUF4129 domain-containing protein [Thermococcus sp.]